MTNITYAFWTVVDLNLCDLRIEGRELRLKQLYQFIQIGALTLRYVVHFVRGHWIGHKQSDVVRVDHILDVREIPRLCAVAMYGRRFMCNEVLNETRNRCGIRPLRVLASSEDIEIPQTDGLHFINGRQKLWRTSR